MCNRFVNYYVKEKCRLTQDMNKRTHCIYYFRWKGVRFDVATNWTSPWVKNSTKTVLVVVT